MARGGKREGAGRKFGSSNRLTRTLADAKRELIDMAKEHGPAALDVLVKVANNTNEPASARVSAATAILDRGYGKPPSETKMIVEKRHEFDWTRDELVAFLADAGVGRRLPASANGRDHEPDKIH